VEKKPSVGNLIKKPLLLKRMPKEGMPKKIFEEGYLLKLKNSELELDETLLKRGI